MIATAVSKPEVGSDGSGNSILWKFHENRFGGLTVTLNGRIRYVHDLERKLSSTYALQMAK